MKKGYIFLTLLAFAISVLTSASLFASGFDSKAEQYRKQGYAYQKMGQYDEALLFYTKASWEEPKSPEYYNDMGIVFELQKRYDKAEEAYLTALSKDENFLKAHTNLGYLYEMQGKLSYAIKHYKERIYRGDRDDAWTHRCVDKLTALLGREVTYSSIISDRNQDLSLPISTKQAIELDEPMVEEKQEMHKEVIQIEPKMISKGFSQSGSSFDEMDIKKRLASKNKKTMRVTSDMVSNNVIESTSSEQDIQIVRLLDNNKGLLFAAKTPERKSR